MKMLNVGCGEHYIDGWINTDIAVRSNPAPDVVVTPGEPYPFEDDHFDVVYMGHVLEHIPWWDVVPFLRDMRRISKPGAQTLVTGPDVYRSIRRWHEGREPWYLVTSVMEHLWQEDLIDPRGGALHYWNCTAERVRIALERAGYSNIEDISDAIPHNPGALRWQDRKTGITWPTIGHNGWACAVRATA